MWTDMRIEVRNVGFSAPSNSDHNEIDDNNKEKGPDQDQ